MSLPSKTLEVIIEALESVLVERRSVPASVNRIAIDELRRSYDILNKSIDKLQLKTLTFLAATFALLTYLYGGSDLFIPAQVYGRVFYFIGLGLVLAAAIIFLLGLKPATYTLTTTIKKLRNISEKSETDYLEYVKSEYVDSFVHNSKIYEAKHALFNVGFIFLVIGAFILIVIKTFPEPAKICYNANGTTCKVVHSGKEK